MIWRKKLFGATMVAAAAIVLTGCGATVAQPTGDELYQEAESLYFDFRETTNGVTARHQ